jgi:hypothetical protein
MGDGNVHNDEAERYGFNIVRRRYESKKRKIL